MSDKVKRLAKQLEGNDGYGEQMKSAFRQLDTRAESAEQSLKPEDTGQGEGKALKALRSISGELGRLGQGLSGLEATAQMSRVNTELDEAKDFFNTNDLETQTKMLQEGYFQKQMARVEAKASKITDPLAKEIFLGKAQARINAIHSRALRQTARNSAKFAENLLGSEGKLIQQQLVKRPDAPITPEMLAKFDSILAIVTKGKDPNSKEVKNIREKFMRQFNSSRLNGWKIEGNLAALDKALKDKEFRASPAAIAQAKLALQKGLNPKVNTKNGFKGALAALRQNGDFGTALQSASKNGSNNVSAFLVKLHTGLNNTIRNGGSASDYRNLIRNDELVKSFSSDPLAREDAGKFLSEFDKILKNNPGGIAKQFLKEGFTQGEIQRFTGGAVADNATYEAYARAVLQEDKRAILQIEAQNQAIDPALLRHQAIEYAQVKAKKNKNYKDLNAIRLASVYTFMSTAEAARTKNAINSGTKLIEKEIGITEQATKLKNIMGDNADEFITSLGLGLSADINKMTESELSSYLFAVGETPSKTELSQAKKAIYRDKLGKLLDSEIERLSDGELSSSWFSGIGNVTQTPGVGFPMNPQYTKRNPEAKANIRNNLKNFSNKEWVKDALSGMIPDDQAYQLEQADRHYLKKDAMGIWSVYIEVDGNHQPLKDVNGNSIDYSEMSLHVSSEARPQRALKGGHTKLVQATLEKMPVTVQKRVSTVLPVANKFIANKNLSDISKINAILFLSSKDGKVDVETVAEIPKIIKGDRKVLSNQLGASEFKKYNDTDFYAKARIEQELKKVGRIFSPNPREWELIRRGNLTAIKGVDATVLKNLAAELAHISKFKASFYNAVGVEEMDKLSRENLGIMRSFNIDAVRYRKLTEGK